MTNLNNIFKKEIELKYDLNHKFNIWILKDFLNKNNIKIFEEKVVERNFTYFDNSNNYFLNNWFTLRCVGWFNPDSWDWKWKFRYDFKVWNTNDNSRKELSIWSNEEKKLNEIFWEIDWFSLDNIWIVAKINKTIHNKFTIKYKKTVIELSLDDFQIEDNIWFRELELELKDWKIEDLVELWNIFEMRFWLKISSIQKYQKVINIIQLTKSKIIKILSQENIDIAFKNYLENVKNIIDNIPENANFIQNPDDEKEHHIWWHQFGIITHSKEVYKNYQEYEKFIDDENIKKYIEEYISQKIDWITKKDLLWISLIYHDVWKFKRTFEKWKVNYDWHEEKSKQLLLPINERYYYREEIKIYEDIPNTN